MFDRILSIVTHFVFVFIDIYVHLCIFFRKTSLNKKLNFREYFVSIDNENHAVCEIGDQDATSDKTLLLIGGIPTNPIESMSWLAEQLHKIDSALRIIIFNMPYYDEHFSIEYSQEFAISNGESLLTQKEIDFSNHKIDPKFIGKKIKSVFWSECFLVVKPFLRELLWQYPEKIVSCILWGSNYFMKNNKPIDAKSFPTLANKITYPAELITYNEGGSKFKDYAEIVKSYGNVDQNEFISLKVIITQSFQKIKYNLNNLGENENLLKPFYPTLYQLFNLSMKGCSKWTKLLRKKYTTDNTRKLEIKWEESLGIRQGIFFWNRCYKNTYNISFNSKLKWLYYQTVRGTLKTNRIISKFKPQISPDCTFCNLETETIIHLFWDCTIVKKFIKGWEKLKK